jgi:hypothetical protein
MGESTCLAHGGAAGLEVEAAAPSRPLPAHVGISGFACAFMSVTAG